MNNEETNKNDHPVIEDDEIYLFNLNFSHSSQKTKFIIFSSLVLITFVIYGYLLVSIRRRYNPASNYLVEESSSVGIKEKVLSGPNFVITKMIPLLTTVVLKLSFKKFYSDKIPQYRLEPTPV